MSSYFYRPLDVAKNEIRLLILQPGQGDSVVEVEIVHHSLDDSPAYEALSYAWGDSRVTKDIRIIVFEEVQGEEPVLESSSWFTTTSSLESALRHLRFVDRNRVLWADAICINQKDNIEKGYQVRQMDRIYGKCSQVCIWLGEAADNSNLAMDLLNSFDEACESEKLKSSIETLTFWNGLQPVAQRFFDDVEFVLHFRALVYLICRNWFNRLWIVQEVVLSPVKMVFCGNKATNWATLSNLSLLLFVRKLSDNRSDKSQNLFGDNRLTIFGDLPTELISRWEIAVSQLTRLGSLTMTYYKSGPPSLRGLLIAMRARGMTDQRDAVYALLSLAGDVSARDWDIDYGTSWIEVFKTAVKVIIETSGCLDIICDAAFCSHQIPLSLSWIPRFENEKLPCGCDSFHGSNLTMLESNAIWKRGESTSPYSTTKGTIPTVSIDEKTGALIADGVIVDRIGSVMEGPKSNESSLVIPKKWFNLAIRPVQAQADGESSNIAEADPEIFEALWRTMIADRANLPNKDAAAPQLGEALRNWLDQENDDLVIPKDEIFGHPEDSPFQRYKSALYGVLSSGQTLIMSEKGRFGLARDNALPGDCIGILFGCTVPVILRSVPKAASEEYLLVGESYIHGLMDGEVMKMFEAGEYKLKDIRIA